MTDSLTYMCMNMCMSVVYATKYKSNQINILLAFDSPGIYKITV